MPTKSPEKLLATVSKAPLTVALRCGQATVLFVVLTGICAWTPPAPEANSANKTTAMYLYFLSMMFVPPDC
jgi:hypothetical protein